MAEALTTLRPLLKSHPFDVALLKLASCCYLDSGMAAEAVSACGKLLERQPDDGQAHCILGAALWKLGRLNEAESLFRRALALQPGFALAHGNLGDVLRELGRLPEAEAVYRQALVLQPDYALVHFNLGNLLRDLGRLSEAAAAYKQGLMLEPDRVMVYSDLGNVLRGLGRLPEAEAAYRQALALQPDFAIAYCNLGNLLCDLGRMPEAEAACRQALALQPDFAMAHSNLGNVLGDMGRLPEAEAAYRQALALQPDFANAYSNLGGILNGLGRLPEAEAAYRHALALQRDHLDVSSKFNLGLTLLGMGRYEEGWLLHESRYSDRTGGWTPITRRPNWPVAQWQGESLEGKRLIVVAEHGFGDSIQFVRYMPLLKAQGVSRVTVVCPPGLVRLFGGVSGIDEIVDSESGHIAFAEYDRWCFMMSLPFLLGTTLQTIPANVPYIDIEASRREFWKEAVKRFSPASQLKVGLVWAGDRRLNQKNGRMLSQRSLDASAYLPLLQIPGITFVSLQRGETTRPQINDFPPEFRPVDPMDDVHDFTDTAAIIECLDLVITVDTSIAHLTGALNKPVWTLLRLGACWRWLQDRDDSPWYPSARLFRQKSAGDWAEVVERVRMALIQLVKTRPV